MKHLDDGSIREIQGEMEVIRLRWDSLNASVKIVKERLQTGSNMLVSYEQTSENFTKWLKVMENVIKEVVPVSSVNEKRAQVQLFRVRHLNNNYYLFVEPISHMRQ